MGDERGEEVVMSNWIADWWKWKFELVIEDRDEVDGSYHDYPLDCQNEVRSSEWIARREHWLPEHRELVGGEPVCAVCGHEWTLNDDLHHRTYMHLGEELFVDLVPLCRTDHVKVHEFFERDVWSLRPGRQHATDVTVARLRAESKKRSAHFCGNGEAQ